MQIRWKAFILSWSKAMGNPAQKPAGAGEYTAKEMTELNSMDHNIKKYGEYLKDQEKSENTIRKYTHDAEGFAEYCDGRKPDREIVLAYKRHLLEKYKISSVNSMLIAVNGFLTFIGCGNMKVHSCRQQRQIFRSEQKELNREDYEELIRAATKNGKHRLACILQTMGSTGIRIGELDHITVEAVERGAAVIRSKGKERVIPLTEALCSLLQSYCSREGICSGPVFVTRGGRPVDRRNVWMDMKRLSRDANISESKVFPHNLRHLFATSFYEKEHDLVRLADFLGHSSVETTRYYTMISSREACMRQLELGMVLEQTVSDHESEKTDC